MLDVKGWFNNCFCCKYQNTLECMYNTTNVNQCNRRTFSLRPMKLCNVELLVNCNCYYDKVFMSLRIGVCTTVASLTAIRCSSHSIDLLDRSYCSSIVLKSVRCHRIDI